MQLEQLIIQYRLVKYFHHNNGILMKREKNHTFLEHYTCDETNILKWILFLSQLKF